MRPLALSLLLAGPTAADFVGGKAQWDELSLEARDGYAMGAFDQMLLLEDPAYNAYKTDLARCVGEPRLNSGHLTEIVDRGYQDVATWRIPPKVVLSHGLRTACLQIMNRYRGERGEPPLE